MILSFINIRKVPREMLKTSGFALGFQHLPRDLANDVDILSVICNWYRNGWLYGERVSLEKTNIPFAFRAGFESDRPDTF